MIHEGRVSAVVTTILSCKDARRCWQPSHGGSGGKHIQAARQAGGEGGGVVVVHKPLSIHYAMLTPHGIMLLQVLMGSCSCRPSRHHAHPSWHHVHPSWHHALAGIMLL